MKSSALLPLLCCLCVSPAFADVASAIVDRQVAVVNGQSITFSEVVREIGPYLSQVRSRPGAPADPEALFRAAFRLALDDAEARALVLGKYEEGEMRIPEHAIDRYAAEILQTRYNGNLQDLQKDLASQNLTYAEWRSRKEEGLVVAAMRNAFVDANASVSPNEVTLAYEARKASFARPARMHLRLASVPAGSDAAAAFASRLAAGEAFGAVAAALAPDRDRDYGFVGEDNALAPMFMEAAASLPDGGTSGPIELAGYAYFLHRIESEEARTVPLAEAWETIRGELLAARREALFRTWTGHLRDAASIRESLPWEE